MPYAYHDAGDGLLEHVCMVMLCVTTLQHALYRCQSSLLAYNKSTNSLNNVVTNGLSIWHVLPTSADNLPTSELT